MNRQHAVAALLAQVEEANGWTDTEVAARARRHGHDLSKQTVSRLRAPIKSINAPLVRSLAAGLGVEELVVVRAFVSALGFDLRDLRAASPEQAIAADTSLSERDRHQLLALLSAMKS